MKYGFDEEKKVNDNYLGFVLNFWKKREWKLTCAINMILTIIQIKCFLKMYFYNMVRSVLTLPPSLVFSFFFSVLSFVQIVHTNIFQ